MVAEMEVVRTLWEALFHKSYENGKVRFDCTGAYGLPMSPSLGALRVTKKLKKKTTHFRTFFLNKKTRKILKNDIQKVSKRVSLFRWWRLLGHLWNPKLIFDSKSEPTAPPKVPQGPKKGSKMSPQRPQSAPRIKNTSKMTPQVYKITLKVPLKVNSGPADCAKHFE